MGQVIWTRTAVNHLREIRLYLARNSPRLADKLLERLSKAPIPLAAEPRTGWRVLEFDLDEVRELFVSPYRLIYIIQNDTCYVTAVLHASRNLTQLPESNDLPKK